MTFLFHEKKYLDFFNTPIYTCSFEGLELKFNLSNNQAISLIHAPYGDIEGEGKDKDVQQLIEQLLTMCEKLDVHSIQIKCKPSFIASNTQLIFHELLEKKFAFNIQQENIQHTLLVDSTPLKDKIHPQEKRKLNSLEDKISIKVLPAPESNDWFSLIQLARSYKGFPLTTSENHYMQIPLSLKGRYFCLGAYCDDLLIATCIAVLVNDRVMYYYMPATHPEYIKMSPSVKLINTMYDLALSLDMQCIDLGISNAQDGTVNHGLVTFKEHMGGIAGVQKKLTYTF
jgi:hypothetical protein